MSAAYDTGPEQDRLGARLRLLSAPSDEPVTISEAREQLRIDDTNEDMLLASLIGAARQAFEEHTGCQLMPAVWQQQMSAWPAGGRIRLGRWPVLSVGAITYRDTLGLEQTLPVSAYHVISQTDGGGEIVRAEHAVWPATAARPDAVSISFTAGHALLPPLYRRIVLMLVGVLYRHREADAELDLAPFVRQYLRGLRLEAL